MMLVDQRSRRMGKEPSTKRKILLHEVCFKLAFLEAFRGFNPYVLEIRLA